MSALTIGVGAAVLTFPLSYYACALTMRLGVVDAPDGERKLQAAPVPRLGGVGIAAAIAIIFLLAVAAQQTLPMMRGHDWLPGPAQLVLVSLAASLALFAIGAWDDVHGMGARTKLVLVTLVCLAAPLLGVSVASLDTPFGTLNWPVLMIAGSALWLIVFTNAANFMDGSNGLSLGCLMIMFAGMGASVAVPSGAAFPPGLAAVIAAIAAFLVHNLAGRLYAGDAGAFGAGGLFATLALVSGLPAWTVATLALPFLADVLLTLVMRAKRGDAWFDAHTDHAYQTLLKSGWSHPEVAALWWTLSGACAVAAVIGVAAGGALPFALFWILAFVLAGLWLSVQRQARNKGARRADG